MYIYRQTFERSSPLFRVTIDRLCMTTCEVTRGGISRSISTGKSAPKSHSPFFPLSHPNPRPHNLALSYPPYPQIISIMFAVIPAITLLACTLFPAANAYPLPVGTANTVQARHGGASAMILCLRLSLKLRRSSNIGVARPCYCLRSPRSSALHFPFVIFFTDALRVFRVNIDCGPSLVLNSVGILRRVFRTLLFTLSPWSLL